MRALFLCTTVTLMLGIAISAQAAGILYGRVTDPLGGGISGAHVVLLYDGKPAATAASAPDGTFSFPNMASGRYSLQIEAGGFTEQSTEPAYFSPNTVSSVEIVMQLAPLKEEMVVQATGTEIPESQTGASISVLDQDRLQNEDEVDLLGSIRQVSGVQVVQSGQYGSAASIFVRGGNGDFNKVLIDGIPANDIGGTVDFGNLANISVGKVELMRGADSVLQGTDAMGSAISITTPRGTSITPEFRYFQDAGSFHTSREAASLAGAYKRFDYYSAFSRFDTQNSLPNDTFHNATAVENFGYGIRTGTSLRLTLRDITTDLGVPGAYDFYAMSDDSSQKNHDVYAGLTLENQLAPNWHNLVRFGDSELHYFFVNPAPTGTPFDPFGSGANYIGQTVTITGANGYSTTGNAILDYNGTYPQTFESLTKRRSLSAESTYRFSGNLSFTGGLRYENESGWTNSGVLSKTMRRNYGYFAEAQGNVKHRLYGSVGLRLEDNAVFGRAAVPRVSAAYYVRKLAPISMLGSIKWIFNAGNGVEEPSILNEGSSLLSLLSTTPTATNLISKYGIAPLGAERSRSLDTGIEQGLWHEHAHVRGTFFDNRFFDLTEFVNRSALPLLGIPNMAAYASGYGAAINSGAYRARGLELEGDTVLFYDLRVQASYTYLDAVVTQSFTSSALGPSYNPNFPGIPIGAFSPLVGGRPFRRAPDSGSLALSYSQKWWGLNLTGYFSGKSDDSTYLSDAFLGNTMLLPNRNLDPAYARVDLAGHYTTGRYSTFFATVENLLDRHYSSPIGYPALPLTFRTGVQLSIGGGK